MKIKMSNGIEYEVCSTGSAATHVEPSDNPSVRSKMYIYMTADSMSLAEFVELFTNEENLQTITMIGDTFETEYQYYTIAQSVGKELITDVDPSTGATVSEHRLVAKLEQLTYIEQQLKALGLL